MNSLHTKLKELRELRERATPGKWSVDKHDERIVHGPSEAWPKGGSITCDSESGDHFVLPNDAPFCAAAANHWLTLISALEKAIGQLENIEVPTIPPVRMTPKELAVFVASDAQRRAQQTLAEIAAMLEKG